MKFCSIDIEAGSRQLIIINELFIIVGTNTWLLKDLCYFNKLFMSS